MAALNPGGTRVSKIVMLDSVAAPRLTAELAARVGGGYLADGMAP